MGAGGRGGAEREGAGGPSGSSLCKALGEALALLSVPGAALGPVPGALGARLRHTLWAPFLWHSPFLSSPEACQARWRWSLTT